ncbi:Cyclin- protein fam58a [Acarospora aff. strigata]|nr:Cyclin- protein fam58a [Acarospora aff. strigata]
MSKETAAQHALPIANDIDSFICIMADVLRLPDETLAMAFLYINKYKRFINTSPHSDLLDEHTLALSSLSLATKSTDSPRRLRSLLLPAFRLLHSHNPTATPLTFPSSLYDSLRATVVQAELVVLRVLKFELRLPLPFEYLPRYLDRTIGEVNKGGGSSVGWGGTEDYEGLGRERKQEDGVVELMETRVARGARTRIVDA